MTTDPELKYEYTLDEFSIKFKAYPHIVSTFASKYLNKLEAMQYLYDLLYDTRANDRKGFPLDKADYLLCFFNKMCQKNPLLATRFLPKDMYGFERNN